MGKFIYFSMMLSFIAASSAFADGCVLPSIIKIGAVVSYKAGDNYSTSGKITAIDNKACWIKIDDTWYNVSQLTSLRER